MRGLTSEIIQQGASLMAIHFDFPSHSPIPIQETRSFHTTRDILLIGKKMSPRGVEVCRVKIFWLRFSIFCSLWIGLISMESSNLSLGIIVFAMALAVYFLLSLQKTPLLLYLLLSIINLVNGLFFTKSVFFSLLILLYLMMDSAYLLKEKWFKVYICIHLFFIFLLLWKEPVQWLPWGIISMIVFFLVLKINAMANERFEQKELYTELLGEYRKLKRLNLESERDVRIQERTMIARDIHDSVGHRLTALLMKLEMLSIERNSSDYDDLKEMAKESLEEIRRSVKTLQSEENEGIATVVQLIRKLEAESHLTVQFTMKQGILSAPLNNEKSVVLYRVIQEGLTNAMRHAGSREVRVTLGKSAIGDIQFKITNRVFKPKPFTFGFGLNNMKARVEEIEGTLEVLQTEEQFILIGTIPTRGGEYVESAAGGGPIHC